MHQSVTDMTDSTIYDQVREYYTTAAREGGDAYREDPRWGVSRYDRDEVADTPDAARELSMGCGVPHAMADLAEGEIVLDLGSGGGLDVILSAKRVGATGRAYGVDFLGEMIDIARANAEKAGVDNAEFLHGMIEDVPLPDECVDVVISNCVICLVPDKRPVFAEIARVLRPGGRLSISDVVAANDAEIEDVDDQWAESGSGALDRDEYLALLDAAGFVDVDVEFTHQTGPGLHGAIIRAVRSA